MQFELDYQAEMLMNKTKHYLITIMGKTLEDASVDELYRALAYTLREEIMINWLATNRTIAKQDKRIVYYLSMEYLPGRFMGNNITNLNSFEIIKLLMQKMNRSLRDVIDRENDPGLGNGGLGRLASCLLDSMATHHYPAQGYGLRYQYGIFEQQLWDGIQIEAPDCWLIRENPWELRRDLGKVTVKYGGHTHLSKNIHGEEVLSLQNFDEVIALPYDIPIVGYNRNNTFSVVTLRLWSTKESPRNFQLQRYNAGQLDQAAENTLLTDVLYPNEHHETGKRIRLKQEFLLVSASVQDIIRHYLTNHHNFRDFADKVRIQVNDTHPSLAIAELIRILTKKHDIPWKTAVDITLACTGYTNHTILNEALEQWDCGLLAYHLPRQYKIIERLNQEFCNLIREKYPNNEDKLRRMSIIEGGKVRMANLAIEGSHKINGVAALHTEILKNAVFKDFYEMFPDRFVNITNGVSQRRWLLHCNPDLARFIIKRIGDGWTTDFIQIKRLAEFATDPESKKEFWEIRKRNKERLIEFLKHENKLRNSHGQVNGNVPIIDVNSLFDVQIKRIHEYKRQLMNALHVLMIYYDLLENSNQRHVKRTVIFAGKAAAGYETAKDIIRLIFCIARKINKDPAIHGYLKVIFVENYNISRAEMIIPASDLSEQISTAGTEASGTGVMKFSMNGALTIGTLDGANIEIKDEITDRWWPFTFGATSQEISRLKEQGSYNPKEIYNRNPKIKRALDCLRDRSLAINDSEHHALSDLYHKLLEGHYGGAPDRYFTLYDLESYYQTQLKVEELYRNPDLWSEYAIHNIAGMGKFSIDNSVNNYSKLVWNLTPCEVDVEILEDVRREYSEHDKCRIY